MYCKVFDQYIKGGRPFHNTVVRCNYNIPHQSLIKLVPEIIINECKEEKLYTTVDGFEAGLYRVKDKKEIKITNDTVSYLLEQDKSPYMFGLFPKDLRFYIRVFLESKNMVAQNETRGGWFELYGDDALVEQVHRFLCNNFDGFFIIESAKKRLEEIML